ncbi:MAG: hypothetical protein UX68_C0024G0007 [Parcubacteria group bacterium GW2011_GWA2_46_9]|nr:MAG: hypothetical protein UX68_C0024G0007 [Parcubacteria group bacterium GW2011_GWA2_46_9]
MVAAMVAGTHIASSERKEPTQAPRVGSASFQGVEF